MSVSSLNSNVMSLRVQRTLGDASNRVYTSYERLATGQRINKASDDAAGLAIADALRVSSRLQTTAIRNINDGISAINIIGGTLGDQTSIVTRLLELAEQSANGTFSFPQRRSLNEEYLALVKEFGRLGETTSFNGLKLLLGGRGSNLSNFGLQAGITGDITSQIGLTLSDTGRISGSIDWDQVSASGITGTITHDELAQATNGQMFRGTLTDSLGVSHEVILAPRQNAGGLGTANVGFTVFLRSSETASGASASADSWTSISTFSPPSVTFNSLTGEYISSSAGGNFVGLANGATIAGQNFDFSGLKLVSSTGSSGSAPIGVATSIDWTGVESQTQARLSCNS